MANCSACQRLIEDYMMVQNLNWLWRVRMVRLRVKSWVAEWIIKSIAPLFRWAPMQGLYRTLPRVLGWLPPGWRGSGYSLCRQNLALFDYDPMQCDDAARRYMAIQLQRQINKYLYEIHAPAQLRERLDNILWVDPQALFQRSQEQPCLVLLTHTGEHWMAVAKIVAHTQVATHFIIPILAFADEMTVRSMKSLEAFGHTVEVRDVNDPKVALAIIRGARQGKRIVIFYDLPVSIGATYFGAPVSGRFLARDAQFVKGPLFLASKLQFNVLLAGHRVIPGQASEFHLFDWVEAGDLEAMSQRCMVALERFIRQSPENWFYLSRMEAYFHRQRSAADMPIKIPNALLAQR
jgi:lauroyl/myristoyl acyltransferase